ncbi:DUF2235 domain-containing protein [Sulfitobacter sp. W074]|uniref:DUF2235 domain-containing protein n=1 Tax=Sulfitobacter sp. W074 TaxID=2867026 RepID=UPI0021A74597|nr:DUF2235 domain-containing protein [Sulfitobacter sp. W074]UWR38403.1 DUF2235 domain-containing protein [Sulfitobacter sp. W074]
MKRIVILCDGTWNRADSETPTNVVRLGQALRPTDRSGTVQVPIYVQGVGTGEGVTFWSQTLDRILGGALGWGLTENIVEAYRHLVFLYEPGDEISILGFSRGAYTARSLSGFIRCTGIIARDDLSLLPQAVSRYRERGNRELNPRSERSLAFRAHVMRSRVATGGDEENTWRRSKGLPEVPLFRIAYLGVWDSVGALGVPSHIPLLGKLTARRYEFHDADLSSMVASARHAVALDEQRRSFEPTLWTNVATLNEEVGAGSDGEPQYQQLYFSGDHGSVGGGGDITELSSIGLTWIMDGATAAGLEFNTERILDIKSEHNPYGPLRNQSRPPQGLIDRLTRLRPQERKGPVSIEEVHPSVLLRCAKQETNDLSYKPSSLYRIAPQIFDRSFSANFLPH